MRRLALVAAVSTAAFVLLATPRLGVQGAYMDEVTQAMGALAFAGKSGHYGVAAQVGRVPLLTVGYAGALKSILYGPWIRLFGFDLLSWRLLGIALVAVALFVFIVLAGPALGSPGLFVFCALFLSDATVLLTARHDWGPVAMAMGWRLAWAALWLRAAGRGSATTAEAALLGAIPGLLLWDKLLYVIFLPAVAVMLLVNAPVRRRWRAVVAGACFGALPLVFINIGFRFISLAAAGGARDEPLGVAPFLSYGREVLSLAAGAGRRGGARLFILGERLPLPFADAEGALLALALVAAAVLAWRARREDARSRWSLAFLAAYVTAAVLAYLQPRGTWVHHWIAMTPFQYLAIALSPLAQAAQAHIGRSATLAGWLLLRTATLGTTEAGLWKGSYGTAYDPAFTTIARFAAAHAPDTLFVVTQWGFATSMYVVSADRVRMLETYWDHRRHCPSLEGFLRNNPGAPYYVVWDPRRPEVIDPTTLECNEVAARLAAGELSVDAPLSAIAGLRKFENPFRSPPGPAPAPARGPPSPRATGTTRAPAPPSAETPR